MKKFFFLFVLFISCISRVVAQGSINLGTSPSVAGCNLLIYDNGGASGDYSSNIDQTLTITSNDPNNGCVVVEVQSLNIDENDTLYFYDGIDTNGTLLHKRTFMMVSPPMTHC